jgi:hypothetical protein
MLVEMEMGLSKKDKEWLRKAIREEMIEVLTVEIEYEKPLKEEGRYTYRNEKHFIPFWWAEHLPQFVGAMRGLQADVGKSNNQMADTTEGLEAMSKILLGIEDGIKKFIAVSDKLSKPKQIEDNKEKKDAG